MDHYCALVAEVRAARSCGDRDREALQLLIADALPYLNALFEAGIEKDVAFGRADEVQGLFRDPLTAFLYYRMLGFILGFDVLRGGLGVGAWSVRVDSGGSASQDGPAHRNARAALAEAGKGRRFDVAICSGNLFDDMLVTLMDHALSICRMRTAVQNETALAVELLRPLVPSGQEDRPPASAERLSALGLSALSGWRDNRGLIGRALACGSAGTLFLAGKPRVLGRLSGTSSEFELTGSDLVGVSYDLAEIARSARQGIDRHLSQGRVAQERNAVALLAFSLDQLFGR